MVTVRPSASVRAVRVEFLSRLYIAELLGYPTAPIIARQRAACERRLDGLREKRADTARGVGDLALEMVMTQLEAIIDWLGVCEAALSRSAGE